MTQSRSWMTITIMCLFSLLQAVAFGKVVPLLASIAEAFHSTTVQTSWLVSAVTVAGIVVAPVGGRLAISMSTKKLICVAVLVEIFGSMIGGFAQSYFTLMAGRLVEGVAFF